MLKNWMWHTEMFCMRGWSKGIVMGAQSFPVPFRGYNITVGNGCNAFPTGTTHAFNLLGNACIYRYSMYSTDILDCPPVAKCRIYCGGKSLQPIWHWYEYCVHFTGNFSSTYTLNFELMGAHSWMSTSRRMLYIWRWEIAAVHLSLVRTLCTFYGELRFNVHTELWELLSSLCHLVLLHRWSYWEFAASYKMYHDYSTSCPRVFPDLRNPCNLPFLLMPHRQWTSPVLNNFTISYAKKLEHFL